MQSMKFLLPIFIFVSVFSHGQSAQDQTVFNNKVWKMVSISSSEFSFFDSNNVFLGSKVEFDSKTVYRDKWKRTLKVYPKSVEVATTKKPEVIVEKSKSQKLPRNANQVVIRRNKATFYDDKGTVTRTAKRRGKKVFFHDKNGKLIGYKIYNADGTKTYKDARGRVTGRSYIDKTGRMIYRAKNRRTRTPRILFEDPFLFS